MFFPKFTDCAEFTNTLSDKVLVQLIKEANFCPLLKFVGK